MRKRATLWAILLVSLGAFGGYAVAYLSGAPVPIFVEQWRSAWLASIDEARLRATLEAGGRVMRHTTTTMTRGGTFAAGTTLAQAIRYSRARALRGRSRALSPELKALYRPYFPEDLLERTRWSLADGGLNLGTVLAGWYYREGAVTLGDVIVYSNQRAANHRWLVAHELTHVLQYEQLGINDFARLYTVDWQLLEQQARRNADRILADLREREASFLVADDAAKAATVARPAGSSPVD